MKRVVIMALLCGTTLLRCPPDPLTITTGRLMLINDSLFLQSVYQDVGTENASHTLIAAFDRALFEYTSKTVFDIVRTGKTRKIILYKGDRAEESATLKYIRISELFTKKEGGGQLLP